MDYYPDKWKMVKMTNRENGRVHYRIFGVWYGGYAGSDSWKMNSGVTRIEQDEHGYHFHGSSGSVYYCNKNTYGTSMYGHGILSHIIKNAQDVDIEEMPEDTDWMSLNYE